MTTEQGFQGFLARHPVVAYAYLIFILQALAVLFLLLLGATWWHIALYNVVTMPMAAYMSFRYIRHPDDPGRFVRFVVRLGGN